MSTISKEEIAFHYKVGVIIACDIAKEYSGSMATIYKEQKDNYCYNKCRDVERSCDQAIQAISRELKPIMEDVKPFIESNMNLIFDTVSLPIDDQRRVYGLVQKLKKLRNQN